MDEKLKKIDEFNANLRVFDGKIKEVEDWLPTGRQRMDDLLNPDNPISAEDRVVQTMELQVRLLLLLMSRNVFFMMMSFLSAIPSYKPKKWTKLVKRGMNYNLWRKAKTHLKQL